MNLLDQQVKKAGVREVQVDGNVYSYQVLPTTHGIKTATRLLKGLGPALGVIFDNQAAGGEEYDFGDEDIFTDLAIALSSRLDELELDTTIKALFFACYVNGEQVDYEQHFAGSYDELVFVLEDMLKENFGSFFTRYLKAKGSSILTLSRLRKGNKEQNQDVSNETSNPIPAS